MTTVVRFLAIVSMLWCAANMIRAAMDVSPMWLVFFAVLGAHAMTVYGWTRRDDW